MMCLTLRPYVLNEGIEPEKLTLAHGFVQVLERLKLEYDLPPDIWAVAEDVLQALKARETNWARERDREVSLRLLRKPLPVNNAGLRSPA
jgi:hypothetical protein